MTDKTSETVLTVSSPVFKGVCPLDCRLLCFYDWSGHIKPLFAMHFSSCANLAQFLAGFG